MTRTQEGAGARPARAGRALALLVLNGFLLILLGVLASLWCHFFTNAFPIVGGLLGLGGLFAWVAFLANLISDDTKEELQRAFEARVLLSRRTWVALSIAAAASVLAAGNCGTIVISAAGVQDNSVVSIEPYDDDASDSEPLDLLAGGSLKQLVSTGLFGERAYRVSVRGLPDAKVFVHGLGRAHLLVPASFKERPVVFVRPEPGLMSSVASAQALSVQVEVRGLPEAAPAGIRGAFWIGCRADVRVPDDYLSRWKSEFGSQGDEAVARIWPPGCVGERLILEEGDEVTVQFFEARSKIGEGRVTIPSTAWEYPVALVVREWRQ